MLSKLENIFFYDHIDSKWHFLYEEKVSTGKVIGENIWSFRLLWYFKVVDHDSSQSAVKYIFIYFLPEVLEYSLY